MTQGINADAVTAWMLANVEGLVGPLSFDLISGGRSNLTFGVTDAAGRTVVLRRPPTSHVLATAHDMSREYRVISALRDTDVPVAPALIVIHAALLVEVHAQPVAAGTVDEPILLLDDEVGVAAVAPRDVGVADVVALDDGDGGEERRGDGVLVIA